MNPYLITGSIVSEDALTIGTTEAARGCHAAAAAAHPSLWTTLGALSECIDCHPEDEEVDVREIPMKI